MKNKKIIWLIFIFLLLISTLSFVLYKSQFIFADNTNNILVENNTVIFDSLTLKQKLAQMIVIKGNKDNLIYTNLNVGGIFLGNRNRKEEYEKVIKEYQNKSKIDLLVSTDMEGSWNPFSNFAKFKEFSKIDSSEEAYKMGFEEGKLMKEIGFNLNFAPVAEFEDKAYRGRAFVGTKKEVEEKIRNYILALQENIHGTCKHYPGKGMIKNLHLKIDKQNISEEDLSLFKVCLENNISSIMIGHQIAFGELDSNNKPSSVSFEVINTLSNFSGLIVSDEINMKGLANAYPSKQERYSALINAGENVILDFNVNLNLILNKLEKLTKEGVIKEENVDESVKKILIFKGYNVQ